MGPDTPPERPGRALRSAACVHLVLLDSPEVVWLWVEMQVRGVGWVMVVVYRCPRLLGPHRRALAEPAHPFVPPSSAAGAPSWLAASHRAEGAAIGFGQDFGESQDFFRRIWSLG